MNQKLRCFFAMLFALFGVFFAPPLSAQSPTREAYVAQSADSSILTFYYDAQRSTRTGKTWGIGDTRKEEEYIVPMWIGSVFNNDSTTKRVVLDASFRDFRPTTTKLWFASLGAVTQIEGLENLNTEKVTDMFGMFARCTDLKSLSLQHFNTEKVTDMTGLFEDCSALTSLDLSHFNTEKVTDMRYMFSGCSRLTSLDLSHFNTQNVTDMSGMFQSCSTLTSLDLSRFNTQNVTEMGYMFDACSGLTSLELQYFNTQNVTTMSKMFRYCYGLTSVRLSGFNTEKVTDMYSMFLECTSLTSLDLRSFNTSNVADMKRLFEGCSNLTKIYSATAWTSGNSYDMFKDCLKLQGVVAYDANKTDATMANSTTGYFTAKPTALGRVNFTEEGAQSIYTLQGKRVHEAWQHLPAGVYVVNGKKMVK